MPSLWSCRLLSFAVGLTLSGDLFLATCAALGPAYAPKASEPVDSEQAAPDPGASSPAIVPVAASSQVLQATDDEKAKFAKVGWELRGTERLYRATYNICIYIYVAASILYLHRDSGTDGYHGTVLVQIANGSVQIANGSVQIAPRSAQIANGSAPRGTQSDQKKTQIHKFLGIAEIVPKVYYLFIQSRNDHLFRCCGH
jgi:hypothetical protein